MFNMFVRALICLICNYNIKDLFGISVFMYQYITMWLCGYVAMQRNYVANSYVASVL